MARTKQQHRPVALDFFSGCGGLTAGLKSAGFSVAAAVEIDPVAVESYSLNHPEVLAVERDVRKISGAQLLQSLGMKRGDVDLVAGCPPCQGFSSLTSLNGARRTYDKRNSLVAEFGRLVKEIEPKAVLMENVPDLENRSAFKKLVSSLRRLGYQCDYKVLDAAHFGVPQRRRRLILVAMKKATFAWPKEKACRTVRQAIGHLPSPGGSGDPLHDLRARHSASVKALIKQIPKNGGSRSALKSNITLGCHKRSDGFSDVYGRIAWGKVAPTITSGCINPSKGRFLHPRQDRALSLREAALLQTFPAKYKFSFRRGKYHIASMIGNALPPRFVESHARKILAALRQ